MGGTVLGLTLIAVSGVLWVGRAKKGAPMTRSAAEHSRRVWTAAAVMIGLWVLDFMILWALAVGAAQSETQIPDSAGYFILAVFLLSGPVAYWIGRRKWMLILPLAIVLVLRVIGLLIALSQ